MASIEEANLLFKNLITYEKSVVMAKKYVKYHKAVIEDLKRLETLEEENAKLKQAIDIIKIKKIDVFELKFSYSVIEYNIMARNSDFDELTQEEYKLLKEVLGNES